MVGYSYTPKRSADYEKHVSMIARGALSKLTHWNATGPHSLTVRVYRSARRGDLDNFCKVVSDALNGVAWDDDRSVVELHASMHDDDRTRPRIEVEVRVLS